MPYGNHKGSAMANVPANYLLWLYNNGKCNAVVKQYIEENKDVLEYQVKQSSGCGKYKSPK